ncbi:MAG: hypothetical protein ACTS4T_01030 [Candidatus Hodgkinia cicadicola]
MGDLGKEAATRRKTTSEGCQRPKLFARQINRRTGCLKGNFLTQTPFEEGGRVINSRHTPLRIGPSEALERNTAGFAKLRAL